MTTIAYSAKHRTIAADRLATNNGIRVGYTPKIMRLGRLLIGGCGTATMCSAFMDWVKNGMHGDCPPMENGRGPDDPGATCFILLGELAVSFVGSGAQRVYAPHHTYGSGSDIARGALELGATPEQAVRAALVYDIYSGGEIDVITLP